MRYYLAMLWLLWFVAYRCNENKKMVVKPVHVDTFVISGGESSHTFDDLSLSYLSVRDSLGGYFEMGVKYEKQDTIKYMEVADDDSTYAYWENGKWEITNCQKALEVMAKSINWLQQELQRKQTESSLNTKYVKQ